MKPRWLAALAVCALLVVGIVAYAMPPDLVPTPAPASGWRVGPHDVKLKVVCDAGVKVPRLLVPRSLLVGPEPRRVGAANLVPAVATGLALSGALVAGGLWFAGRGKRAVAASLLVLGLFGLGAGAILANVPAPPPDPRELLEEARPKTKVAARSIALPADIRLPAEVQLEVAEHGDCLVLTVPPVAAPKPAPAKEEGFRAVPVAPGN